MLVDFLLRLAAGMALVLLVLSPADTARPTAARKPVANANFFRTHLLVILGLASGAALWRWPEAGWLTGCLLAAALCAALGSVSWSLERSPGAVTLLVLTALALLGALWLREEDVARLLGGLSSALLLGAATGAMLMGHNYLVAPNLTMTPLYRLLGALAIALGLRAAADGAALALWTREHELSNLTGDALLWLPVRWLVGLAAPAALTWMAWQTARIRSTQSATGILYVVVIFCFLGEVTAQLLRPVGLAL
jgi:hypothetical protein